MADDQRDFEGELQAAWPALVRSATVLCRSAADVEDVVQETMMQAYRAYPGFRGESAFLTWAYVILARVASKANRRALRDQNLPAFQAEALPPVDAGIVKDETARRVIDAIRRLPERQREMMTLHFLDERPYREIAQALGVSEGTVKSTIHSAKQSLRAALARDETEEP